MSHRRQTSRSSKEKRIRTQAAEAGNGAIATQPLPVSKYWLAFGSIALLLSFLWAYWPTLLEIVHQWINQPDYSHGFLVVPIALFFLWTKRSQMPHGEFFPSIGGLVLLLFACALRVAAGL